MKNKKYIARIAISKPLWGWYFFKASHYFPDNDKKHRLRVGEYDLFKRSSYEVLENIFDMKIEKINDALYEFQEISVTNDTIVSEIPAAWDASHEFAEICYCTVRLKKPSIVVETGVCRGMTSYFILEALKKNGNGHLYSIDLPFWGFKEIGQLVPKELKGRWTLILGPSIPEMKKLRKKQKSIDIFIHDSDHKYSNQLAEFKIALDWLSEDGILIADDIGNDALIENSEEVGIAPMIIQQSKEDKIGVIRKNSLNQTLDPF